MRRSHLAEGLLRPEGLIDVQYVPVPSGSTGGVPGAMRLRAGEIDFDANFAAPLVVAVDRGAPIVILGGVHVGLSFAITSSDSFRGQTFGLA